MAEHLSKDSRETGREIGRRPFRVSFSVFNKEEEELSMPDAETSDVDTGHSHSPPTPPQQYKRRRSSVATLVVERFVKTKERRWSVGISALVSTIPAQLMGITLGYPSNTILDLSGDATELPPDYLLTTSILLLSLFAGLAPVGAIFGGPIGGWVADRWGRKCSMMFCGVPYLIGYLTLSYAHYAPTATAFHVLLLTGRFFSGVGMGWISVVAPVYIGELSSARLRGLFVPMTEASLVVGIITYFALGSIRGFFYYYISLVAVGMVAIFEIFMIWLPETPRWLLSRGYGEDAEKVINWLRGPAIDVSKEMEEIKYQIIASRTSAKAVWKMLLTKKVFVPFVYVLTTVVFTQLTGVNAISSFAGDLLSEAGVAHPRITSIYTIGIANLAGTVLALLITDLIGRKTLLIASGLLMAVGTCMLGIHFFITRPSLCSSHQSYNTTLGDTDSVLDVDSKSCNPQYGPLAIVSLILYNFSFSIGWGPVPWLLLSELLPLLVRGVAAGFAMIINWAFAAITIGLYLEYAELVQPWFAMWTFLLMNLTSVLFVLLFIPETKGKTLEEVERKFERRPKVVETVL